MGDLLPPSANANTGLSWKGAPEQLADVDGQPFSFTDNGKGKGRAHTAQPHLQQAFVGGMHTAQPGFATSSSTVGTMMYPLAKTETAAAAATTMSGGASLSATAVMAGSKHFPAAKGRGGAAVGGGGRGKGKAGTIKTPTGGSRLSQSVSGSSLSPSLTTTKRSPTKRATTAPGPPQKRAAMASEDSPDHPRAVKVRSSSVVHVGEEVCVSAENNPKSNVRVVSTPKEANNPSLKKWACKQSICIIRGLVKAIGFDVDLFNGDHILKGDNSTFALEVRDQPANVQGDSNWLFRSTPATSTLGEYIKYQDAIEPLDGSAPTLKASSGKENLKFGTNLDLSDSKRWAEQLREIAKLPAFLKLKKHGDLLNRIGYKVYGMNTVQMYLKIKGARTPAHQENNNFVSGNLSLGPGQCEWFSVDIQYQEQMKTLCTQRKVNYLSGSWWPNLEDLEAAGIPFKRFIQEPGDFVYTNMGTIHWVQALGRCQNVAWNIGPMSGPQLRLAWERYHELRLQKEQSLVPMHRVTWGLVNFRKKTSKFDDLFVQEIMEKATLSLENQKAVVAGLEQQKVKVHRSRFTSEQLNQHIVCAECLDEPWNTFYLEVHPTNSEKEAHIYCTACAVIVKERVQLRCIQLQTVAELTKAIKTFANGGHGTVRTDQKRGQSKHGSGDGDGNSDDSDDSDGVDSSIETSSSADEDDLGNDDKHVPKASGVYSTRSGGGASSNSGAFVNVRVVGL